jgi:general secretion pathway protein F
VVISLLLFVIPEIVVVFEDLNQQLPEITRLLINASEFLQANGLLIMIILVALFVGSRLLLKISSVKMIYHAFLLRLPLIGNIIKVLNTSRFIRTLAILSSSKVETMNALLIASQVLSNLSMRQAVESASKQVREGSSLSNALAREKCFPEITTHLISSGEASGNLSEMLDSTANYHEREVQSMTTTLVGIFEPLLILVMGAIVLVIVIAILLPIFEMNQLVS